MSLIMPAIMSLPPTGVNLFQGILLGIIIGEWFDQCEQIRLDENPIVPSLVSPVIHNSSSEHSQSQNFESTIWPRLKTISQSLSDSTPKNFTAVLTQTLDDWHHTKLSETRMLLELFPLLIRLYGDLETQNRIVQKGLIYQKDRFANDSSTSVRLSDQSTLKTDFSASTLHAILEEAKLLGYLLAILPQCYNTLSWASYLDTLTQCTNLSLDETNWDNTSSGSKTYLPPHTLNQTLQTIRSCSSLGSLEKAIAQLKHLAQDSELNTTVAIALLCIVSTPGNFSLSLQRSKLHNQSPQSIGPLIGALSGACYGLAGIPLKYQAVLPEKLRREILEIARRLFRSWAGCHSLERPDPFNQPLTVLGVRRE